MGSSYRSRGGTIEDIKALIKHPSFDSKYYINDVAIAIAAHAIPFSNNVRQGTISQSYSELETESVVTLVGWGATKVLNLIEIFFYYRTLSKSPISPRWY